jgi:predicted nuclease with TOPRIM domain
MSDPSPAPLPPDSRSLLTRICDATRSIVTVADYLKRLETENARIQNQLLSALTTMHDLQGQLKQIEKRLEDKDKMVEATVQLRLSEAVARLRDEFSKGDQPPP